MSQETAVESGQDQAANYKMVLGVKMFIAYGVIYAGFVLINIIKPIVMEKEIILGLNLAVTYGFGLIILALILAVTYNHLCTQKEQLMGTAKAAEEVKNNG